VHEEWGVLLRGIVRREGIFYFRWVVFAVPICIVLFFLFRGFLRRLPDRTRRWVIAAGGLYLAGAVGMDMVGGYLVWSEAVGDVGSSLLETIENTLELSGVTVFLFALFGHLEAGGANGSTAGTGHGSAAPLLVVRWRIPRLLWWLAAVSGIVLLATAIGLAERHAFSGGRASILTALLDPHRSRSLPSWYASMLMALVAGLVWARIDPPAARGGFPVRSLLIACLVFASIDRIVDFPGHRSPVYPLADQPLAQAWQIVRGVAAIALMTSTVVLCAREPTWPGRIAWPVAGASLVAGTVGVAFAMQGVAPASHAAAAPGIAGLAGILAGLLLMVRPA